ncbi:hypothetical protein U4W29_13415, partial [Escherichia coli]|nr:hypothetical protein [Escherichia coli]
MSVSRRVIHHGLYFAVLGPLIGVLFLVLYIFFAKEPLVLLVIIQVLPLFLLLSITTGAIPALLTGVMVALKWSTKTGHRVRVFSSIDFPIRLVVT